MQSMYQIYKRLDYILLNRYVQLSTFYIILFLFPILLPRPQFLLGTLINFLLILGITQFKFKQILPALFLPSIASYTYGLLFGSATHFLLYLIPVIGVGNIVYVLIYKYIRKEYLNILIASSLKAIFLFSSVLVLNKIIGLPSIFLTSMGVIQLFTALTGGLLARYIFRRR